MANEPQTLNARRAMIARWEKDWSAGGDVYLAVVVGGEIAGSAGLHRRQRPDTVEIGYWTHISFLRQGVATRVASLLTETALVLPEIARVEIHHDKANVASSAIPRRLGYEPVGEHPDGPQAPAETGIDCVWRIERGQWTGRSRQAAPEASRSRRPREIPGKSRPSEAA
jgi:RimJ/RimL family protein N-acetyltransferase